MRVVASLFCFVLFFFFEILRCLRYNLRQCNQIKRTPEILCARNEQKTFKPLFIGNFLTNTKLTRRTENRKSIVLKKVSIKRLAIVHSDTNRNVLVASNAKRVEREGKEKLRRNRKRTKIIRRRIEKTSITI